VNDLRNPPCSKAPADHSVYGDQSKTKESGGLPICTQQRFLDADRAANALGSPLNTLLSIRTPALLAGSDGFSPRVRTH
jgi:hypothetical protein